MRRIVDAKACTTKRWRVQTWNDKMCVWEMYGKLIITVWCTCTSLWFFVSFFMARFTQFSFFISCSCRFSDCYIDSTMSVGIQLINNNDYLGVSLVVLYHLVDSVHSDKLEVAKWSVVKWEWFFYVNSFSSLIKKSKTFYHTFFSLSFPLHFVSMHKCYVLNRDLMIRLRFCIFHL